MPKKAKVPLPRMERIRGDNELRAMYDDWRLVIKQVMELEGLSVAKFARRAQVSDVTVRNFLTGKTLAIQVPTAVWILGAAYRSLALDRPPSRPRRRRKK